MQSLHSVHARLFPFHSVCYISSLINQITILFDVLCLPILIACLILYFANLGLIIELYHFPVEMFDIKFVSVEKNEIV